MYYVSYASFPCMEHDHDTRTRLLDLDVDLVSVWHCLAHGSSWNVWSAWRNAPVVPSLSSPWVEGLWTAPSWMNVLLAATYLMVVTLVDGTPVSINPAHISSLHPSSESAKGKPNTLIAKGAKCVILLSSGKFYSVTEDCSTIRKWLQEIK